MAQRQFRSDDTDKWIYGFGNGSDGDGSINTSTDAPIDSACSGTSGATSLTATNASFSAGQLVLIHQTRGTGAGAWELNRIASYSAGTVSLVHALTNTYTNSGASVAQIIVGTQYNNLTINNAQTLTAKAWNGTVGGIVFKFVKGTCTVTGSINAVGKGFRGGGGDSYGNNGWQGESTLGVGVSSMSANGIGGGGAAGYGNYYQPAGGAGGGHSTNGTNGTTNPSGTGIGGGTIGVASLVSSYFGGGGGGGTGTNGGNWVYGGNGGAGGGFVFLIAKDITVNNSTGSILTTGGNGTSGGTISGGGGGGAGGSILIKAQTATLNTTRMTSTNGSGGGGVGGGNSGASGGNGRIHLDYKTSYSGTTSPSIDVTQDLTLNEPAGGGFLWNFV